ncbi:DUF1993 family protein [Vibrio fluvialis]|uniref:DUF1993 family protein n=1 Tax=Vibrio fluvialis TaxID=676 RepID=UPI001EE9EEF6|nr:DUF1993 family protein [Vibrio fluvialis]MCG6348362.1 DUF1993 domain-containing protein [Vibrio fluvialis]
MDGDIKALLMRYLTQLDIVVEKIPPELFATALADDMFSLEMNAKIAANFALRGYCPLARVEEVSFFTSQAGKQAVRQQIAQTLAYLEAEPALLHWQDDRVLKDNAGETTIALAPFEFFHLYIVPNMLFHLSMVYAIARANGVALSKGDMDGLHRYSPGFSFLPK